MITKWKIFNFKSIREETELELGPLTIFAGANSSGKSTFIQSILLVAQTLSHKIGSRSVVLNGSLASLGQFDDLKSTDSESDQISIQCSCRPLSGQGEVISPISHFATRSTALYGARSSPIREISCEISFDADPSSPQRELFQIQPRLFATRLSCIYRDDDNIDQNAFVAIRTSSKLLGDVDGKEAARDIDDSLRNGLGYAVEMDDASMSEAREDFRSAVPAGCILKHFLPERILYAIDTVEENASALTMALRDDGRSAGSRRAMGRELLFSERVVAVLRDVLKETIDFDHVFTGKYRQAALFETEGDILTFREWYERLRSLSRDERLRVQQVLRDCEDLPDRIHAAMRESLPKNPESRALVPARPPRLIIESTRYVDTLLDWSKLLDEPWIAIHMSERASEALIKENLFPLRKQLRDLFDRHGIVEFSVNDIATVAERLLSITPSFETYYCVKEVLSENLETDPDVIRLTTYDGLQSDLGRCITLIAVLRKHCSQPLGGHSLILREAPKQVVHVKAQIHEIEHSRSDLPVLPHPPEFFEGDVLVCDDFHGLIDCLDESAILVGASDDIGVELAIRIAAFKYTIAQGGAPDWSSLLVPTIGVKFRELCLRICADQGESVPHKILRSIVETIRGHNLAAVHALRIRRGGNSPQRERTSDKAKAQRRDIDYELHLHYWDCANRTVELASVVYHNDFSIPE